MHLERTVEELLSSACPSIQFRLRREILGEDPDTAGMQTLQVKIIQDEAVNDIIRSQHPGGWLGDRFHGYDGLEAGIRTLCEKGVNSWQPVLVRAICALETNPERIIQEMGTAGKVLDEGGYGGTTMMQAVTFAYAGQENIQIVRGQIDAALEGLRAVTTVESLGEITETYKEKLIFRPGVRWPGIYHLRLLALTNSWRNPQNKVMLVEAVKRLVELSPFPQIYVRYKSQIVAPASFGMLDFNPVMASMDAAQWMMWFHRMELLARLDVIRSIPALSNQVNILQEMLDAGDGWFTLPVNHAYFKRWGAYTGLMLERDWRTARRRVFDLTFRCHLIQHHFCP